MIPALRWGIVGTGWASGMFTDAVVAHTDQIPTAVTGRDASRTRAFAQRHGIARVYACLDDLLQDPDIDIVYIATPHDSHVPLALRVLAAGRPVLIEKPLAMTAAGAARIADAAAAAQVLAMEAMWSSYLPRAAQLRRLLGEGRVGRPVEATASFGAVFDSSPSHRTQDPARGGGVLLDLGIYHLAWVRDVLGDVSLVDVRGTLTPTGVEDVTTLVVTNSDGARGVLSMSMREAYAGEGSVIGTAGRIDADPPFFLPGGLTVLGVDGGVERWEDRSGVTGAEGMGWQAMRAAEWCGDGTTDSPVRPLRHVIADLGIIDEARDALGAAPFPA